MNMRFVVLGLNIIIVSSLVAIYGYIVNEPALIGVGASTGMLGGVLVVLAYVPVEPSQEAISSYLATIVNGITTVLEDLDLLNYKLCVDNTKGKSTLLVYSKTDCPRSPNPGIGQHLHMPYLSIPTGIFQDVFKLETVTSSSLEDALSNMMVSVLGVCRVVKVEIRGDFIVVDVIGISRVLLDYLKYPVDPVTVITTILVTKLTNASRLELVEREITMNNMRLVMKAGTSVQ